MVFILVLGGTAKESVEMHRTTFRFVSKYLYWVMVSGARERELAKELVLSLLSKGCLAGMPPRELKSADVIFRNGSAFLDNEDRSVQQQQPQIAPE